MYKVGIDIGGTFTDMLFVGVGRKGGHRENSDDAGGS